jgi:pimeloyl-ACP methyl ester carboxylesterase
MTLALERHGRGPQLVLLHALGADRRVWRSLIERLAPHRELVLVDLPGFGATPPLAADPPDPAALAAAVADGLAAHGVRGPHLAGNSLGGWVALELALRGTAASVTAIAPAGLWPRPLPPKPEIARTLARTARGGLLPALRAGRGRGLLGLAGSVAHPERIPPGDAAALVEAYAGAPGFTAVNRAMRAAQPFAGLHRIPCPVTVAWCGRDRLVAPARLPAGVREVVLPDAGHLPMWDDPEGVAAVLLAGSAAGLEAAA